MPNDLKKEVRQMALFWFFLPLIVVSAFKTLRRAAKSWRVPQEMWE